VYALKYNVWFCRSDDKFTIGENFTKIQYNLFSKSQVLHKNSQEHLCGHHRARSLTETNNLYKIKQTNTSLMNSRWEFSESELLLEAEKQEISGFTKLFPVLSKPEQEKSRKFPVFNIENRKNRKFPYFFRFCTLLSHWCQNNHLGSNVNF